MNTNDFIIKAKKIHGNKYDYSKVEYKNCDTKVCIICPEHGEFWQTPHSHLSGKGCQKCGKNKKQYRSTNEYFIKRAFEIHGDKYDYSKVNYINSQTKVCIICPEHGEFWQTPHDHLNSNGCSKCRSYKTFLSKRKKTTEQFIEDAREVHGDKYDYSKVQYIDNRTKVCIICPEHGEFWQTPSSHLRGRGCSKCSKFVINTENFIKRAFEIHGDKYDYSKVEYINSQTKVCIICPEHGEFWQTPSNHLSGKGCQRCYYDSEKVLNKGDKQSFIKKARKIHGNKYDYSKVNYIDSKTKVCIICPIHGEFWQIPNKHLCGHGCQKCTESKLETEVRTKLEELHIPFVQEFKDIWTNNKKYDFCIKNKKILIECQGEQHYFPVDFGFNNEKKSLDNYKKNIINDEYKKKLAIYNGYKLLYYTKKSLKKNNEITDINDLMKIIESYK